MSTLKLPHSWSVETWPPAVYPHTPKRARYFIRAHKNELLNAGALVRPGREIVIIGARYGKWLERQATSVLDFDCAANRGRADLGEGAAA